jgi:hypothetical protein
MTLRYKIHPRPNTYAYCMANERNSVGRDHEGLCGLAQPFNDGAHEIHGGDGEIQVRLI